MHHCRECRVAGSDTRPVVSTLRRFVRQHVNESTTIFTEQPMKRKAKNKYNRIIRVMNTTMFNKTWHFITSYSRIFYFRTSNIWYSFRFCLLIRRMHLLGHTFYVKKHSLTSPIRRVVCNQIVSRVLRKCDGQRYLTLSKNSLGAANRNQIRVLATECSHSLLPCDHKTCVIACVSTNITLACTLQDNDYHYIMRITHLIRYILSKNYQAVKCTSKYAPK